MAYKFLAKRHDRRSDGFFRRSLFLFLLIFFIACSGEGGESVPGKNTSNQNELYGQAIRNVEQELLEQDTLLEAGNGWGVSAFLSIAALALALGVTAWLARRLRVGGLTRGLIKEIVIMDRLPLGRHSMLFIVKICGWRYWLAEHSHGVNLLGECPDEKGESVSSEQSIV